MSTEKKVMLVSPATMTNRTPEENLGLEYLTAEARAAGFETHLVEGWLGGMNNDQIEETILNENPEVLGISPSMDSVTLVNEMCQNLRAKSYSGQIILGGVYASFEPGSILFSSNGAVDGILIGEADDSFLDFLRSGSLENTASACFIKNGRVVRTPGVNAPDDLDKLPFPVRESLETTKKLKTPAHVMGSRGCYGNCSFCSVACFQKFSSDKRWRGRSPESIVRELKELNSMGETMVKFVDDNFFGGKDKQRELRIAQLIQENGINMRFRLSLRVNDVSDELIVELKRAGLFAVSLGVESFVPRKLRDFSKGTKLEQNLTALEILRKHGIYVQMGHIMFDPFTTLPEIEQELHYLQLHNWAITKGICTQLFAAEGTAITKRIKKEVGFADKSGTNNLYLIQDEKARNLYDAMRIWARHNSTLYDTIIDPLSAPKNIPDEGHQEFAGLCMEIKNLDLEVASTLLSKAGHMNRDELLTQSNDLIQTNQQRLSDLTTSSATLYAKYGLDFRAQVNKHIY